jgi:flagellar hook assembly protein FlgD
LVGQEIKTLKHTFQNAGEYQVIWDGTDNKGNPASSGPYFYNLAIGDRNLQRKMLLVR